MAAKRSRSAATEFLRVQEFVLRGNVVDLAVGQEKTPDIAARG